MKIVGIVIVVLIVVLIIWLVATYNKFIKMQNKVEEGFSTMDVYLKKRYDLIPNLVESVKGYAAHESKTLNDVISARNMAVQATTLDQKIQGEQKLQSMLGPLYAISEQYPNLKADQNFMDLQNQLKSMEGEIANARKYYNAVCVKFNNLVEMFPSNLLAGIFHFSRKPLYEVNEDHERENVKVQF